MSSGGPLQPQITSDGIEFFEYFFHQKMPNLSSLN